MEEKKKEREKPKITSLEYYKTKWGIWGVWGKIGEKE